MPDHDVIHQPVVQVVPAQVAPHQQSSVQTEPFQLPLLQEEPAAADVAHWAPGVDGDRVDIASLEWWPGY